MVGSQEKTGTTTGEMVSCEKGEIYRKSYTRKLKSGDVIRVAGKCIRKTTRYTSKVKSTMKSRLRGVRMSRRALRSCPSGTIKRDAYMRYTRSGKHVLVPESCIRDVGAPGKGLRGGPGIGPLRRGELAKHGYTAVQKMSVDDRHAALDRAVGEFGGLGVWRKLNAVAIYTRRTSPEASRVFKADMDYIRNKYGLKAF